MLQLSRLWMTGFVVIGLLTVTTDVAFGARPRKRKRANPVAAASATDPDETKDKPAIESEQLKPAMYRGLLVSAPNEGGLFRIAVEYQRLRVKPGREAEYDRLQKQRLRHIAKAKGNQVKAEARTELTPFFNDAAPLPDRRAISRALGLSVASATMAAGEKKLLNGLVEKVSDTQTVIFHAAPKINVRVLDPTDKVVTALKPSDQPIESTRAIVQNEKTQAETDAPSSKDNPKSSDDTARTKKKVEVLALPGYAGKMTDLKVGQRVLIKMEHTSSLVQGALYRHWVVLLVVEEEPKS